MIFPIFLHYYLFWPQTEPPRDALDTLTLSQADLASLNTIEQTDFLPFDPITKRTEGTLRDTVTGVSSLLLSTLSCFYSSISVAYFTSLIVNVLKIIK